MRSDPAPAAPGLLRAALVGAVLVLAALGAAVVARPAAADELPTILVEHLYDLDGGMTGPTDVGVDATGRAFVLDGVNLRVVVFDASGRRTSSFQAGTAGEDGERPTGLAVSSEGRVYVADAGGRRVLVLSANGGAIASWSLPSGSGGPADPTDVALDEAGGRAFVIDNDNHRVQVLSSATGRVSSSIGQVGAGSGQLRYPFLGAWDAARSQLLVTDVLNARAQAFDGAGRYVATVGTFGVTRGRLYRPKGIAADAQGLRYVSDSFMGVIQAFGADGTFRAVLAAKSGGHLIRLEAPTGVAVSKDGRIFVAETGRNRVRVYRLPVGT